MARPDIGDMVMAENHFFAATLSNIGETSTDGCHIRIWGVGTTEESARMDAVDNLGGDSEQDDFEVVGTTEAVYARVKQSGHDHGREYSIGGHCGFIDAIYRTVLDGEHIRLA